MCSGRRLLLAVAWVVVGASVAGCSDPYVGSSEAATVVIGEGSCNVGLAEGDAERHGLRWYSKATVDTTAKLPGSYEGTLTFTGERDAVFEGDGVLVAFAGLGDDEGTTVECPGVTPRWNPAGPP